MTGRVAPLETPGIEQLRAMVRGVLEGFAARDPARFTYREGPGTDAEATIHRLERVDLMRGCGIAVAVEHRLREHGKAVRRAIVDGRIDYGSAMTVYGESAEDWKIRRWAEDLASTDGTGWR